MGAGRQLIVVLPGIGGSVLARPGPRDDVVWDASKSSIGGVVVRPSRLSVDEAPVLEPVGLTESTRLLGLVLVPGYELLLKQLDAFGVVDRRGDPRHPVPGADVVAVPYDFRRSIVEAAERLDDVVNAHLDGVGEGDRAGRVTVVAHSMGGLVARVWMALMKRWPWCRALITLGTPHRGAPKALDWLVNGAAGLGVARATMRTWPGVYELIPRYRAVQDSATGAAVYPHELPIGWLTGPAREAYDLHVQLEQACGDLPVRGPETVPCIGWAHRTPDAMFWSEGKLRVTKQHPDWLGLGGWEQDFGDGTVPSYSALPPEMDNHVHGAVRVMERHVPLSHTALVTDLLTKQQTRVAPTPVHGGEPDRSPALGLDLDDVNPEGEPIPVRADIREVNADLRGQVVWARLSQPMKPPVDVRLDWDEVEKGFVGLFPAQAPGLYEVRVQAREVLAAGDLVCSDTVAVVTGD